VLVTLVLIGVVAEALQKKDVLDRPAGV